MLRQTVRTFSLSLAVTLGLPALAAAQQPGRDVPPTHTVRPGDTLWGLATRFFGDPLLWPEIYRRNTMVVEDPHWIYPGEVLKLSGDAMVSAVPQGETPDSAGADGDAAADTTQAPIFARGERAPDPLPSAPSTGYRSLRASSFYSSGFLTEGRGLPFGRVGNAVVPSQIRSSGDGTGIMLYTNVAVEPAAGGSYAVGDSLLVGTMGPRFQGHGQAFVPTGLLRVTQVEAGAAIATVVAVYGPIRPGQRALPAERFADPGEARPQPVTGGTAARVIGGPLRQDLRGPQDVVFLDRGSKDGVAAGDVFEVRRTAGRDDGAVRVDDLMAVLQVVRAGERTATARVVRVISPDIPAGTGARQVAKLGS
jgi:hypothetical protein